MTVRPVYLCIVCRHEAEYAIVNYGGVRKVNYCEDCAPLVEMAESTKLGRAMNDARMTH